jgi:hypothetical protein
LLKVETVIVDSPLASETPYSAVDDGSDNGNNVDYILSFIHKSLWQNFTP